MVVWGTLGKFPTLETRVESTYTTGEWVAIDNDKWKIPVWKNLELFVKGMYGKLEPFWQLGRLFVLTLSISDSYSVRVWVYPYVILKQLGPQALCQ